MYMHVYTSYNFMQSFTQIIDIEKSGVCLSTTSRFSCWASNVLLSNGQGKLSPTKKKSTSSVQAKFESCLSEGQARIPIFLIPGYLVF